MPQRRFFFRVKSSGSRLLGKDANRRDEPITSVGKELQLQLVLSRSVDILNPNECHHHPP
jgi:hypothetical protein